MSQPLAFLAPLKDDLDCLEVVMLMLWLLKDLGWVLHFPLAAWPGGLVAVGLEGYLMTRQWGQEPLLVWGHRPAVFLWLVGNGMWMSCEFLFGDTVAPGLRWPWFQSPLAVDSQKGDPDKLANGLLFSQCAFVAALLGLLLLYGRFALRRSSRDACRPWLMAKSPKAVSFMSQDVYGQIFIGPWILKDVAWSFSYIYVAVLAGVVVVGLILDSYRRFRDPAIMAELCWVAANLTWIVSELWYKDQGHLLRLLAAGFLWAGITYLAGFLLTGVYPFSAKALEEKPNERSFLLPTKAEPATEPAVAAAAAPTAPAVPAAPASPLP